MGLIYDAGDSEGLQSALSANLTAATSVLERLESASDRLVAALGAGELSGEGYSAVDALFSMVVAPCVVRAKGEIESVQAEVTAFAAADSRVSRFGVLREDELQQQLTATKKQRDATEHQIEVNTRAANAATAVPGLIEALEVKNGQLELVLNQLENDVRDLEDRLKALRDFASATRGLFMDSLENLAAATGDTIALLNQLNQPFGAGIPLLETSASAAGAAATRKQILEFLAGKKITEDAKGRLKWGNKFLYNRTTEHLYGWGKSFNGATGIRIDEYMRPLKAGGNAALKAPISDLTDWKNASKLGKYGKAFGAVGTVLTVADNANSYFADGIQGYDVQDFAVDTGVDFAAAAAATGVGAVVGSAFLPPAGTVVGAVVGFIAGVALNNDWFGPSVTDVTKKEIKKAYR